MRVAVGSRNPVKLAATEDAFAALSETTVKAVSVDSGVSEQPRGEAETIAGAENRARNAVAAGEFDFGVGLEGGVAEVPGTDGLYLIMWGAVTDGTTMGRGGGTRLRLPESIASRIRDGEELGPVMDDVLGTENVAENRGAAGVLSGDVIGRQEALKHALAGALGPFLTDRY